MMFANTQIGSYSVIIKVIFISSSHIFPYTHTFGQLSLISHNNDIICTNECVAQKTKYEKCHVKMIFIVLYTNSLVRSSTKFLSVHFFVVFCMFHHNTIIQINGGVVSRHKSVEKIFAFIIMSTVI